MTKVHIYVKQAATYEAAEDVIGKLSTFLQDYQFDQKNIYQEVAVEDHEPRPMLSKLLDLVDKEDIIITVKESDLSKLYSADEKKLNDAVLSKGISLISLDNISSLDMLKPIKR